MQTVQKCVLNFEIHTSFSKQKKKRPIYPVLLDDRYISVDNVSLATHLAIITMETSSRNIYDSAALQGSSFEAQARHHWCVLKAHSVTPVPTCSTAAMSESYNRQSTSTSSRDCILVWCDVSMATHSAVISAIKGGWVSPSGSAFQSVPLSSLRR